MKTINAEFFRPIEVARVANTGSHEKIVADANECLALARRLKLPTVVSVAAHLVVKPWSGGGYKVTGEVVAEFEQESVVSLETFLTKASFPVERYFLKKARDLDADEADADVIESGLIDLGEVAAETIGLELDPYPRKPGEAFAGHEEETTAKVTPFALLRKTDK